MRLRNDNTLKSIGAAAVLVLGCEWPLAALAQDIAPTDGPITCGDFQRVANGSWTVVHPTRIEPQGVQMNLSPGQTFAKNQWVGGIEVTTVLDRNCGNE
jgi:hypothetical protein